MNKVTCPKGHPLPDHFHHGPDNEREPCPVCGSTARSFHVSATDDASTTDEATATTVTATRTISWQVNSKQRAEAEATRQLLTYVVDCERLPSAWLVTVRDTRGISRGGGVADDAEDAALAAAQSISEAMEKDEQA